MSINLTKCRLLSYYAVLCRIYILQLILKYRPFPRHNKPQKVLKATIMDTEA